MKVCEPLFRREFDGKIAERISISVYIIDLGLGPDCKCECG